MPWKASFQDKMHNYWIGLLMRKIYSANIYLFTQKQISLCVMWLSLR